MNQHSTIPIVSGLLFGLIASVAHAQVDVSQSPLVVAKPLPPNILFILDDSGSMRRTYMPDNAPQSGIGFTTYNSTSHPNYSASSTNLMAYNPLVTYRPWYNADGTPMGAASRTAVSTDTDRITGSTTNLLSNSQCFHTPRTSGSNPNNSNQLYRWRLNTNGTSISRCNANSSCTNSSGCTTVANGSNATITWDHGSTPVTRTVAAEWQNYANWYHYHRTRMKMAKAASSRAFAQLWPEDERESTPGYRVGFTTINSDSIIQNIPVDSDDGLFRGSNRTNWFSTLNSTATPSSSALTPLRASLDRAGQYFSSNTASGPWGPQAAAEQFSCRQNFTIMTTDGYWNSSEAGTSGARADNDSTAGEEITGPNGMRYQYEPARPYRDGRSNTLADVAMYYWKTDLREDLRNDVPSSAANPAFWQHMVTFGVSLGAAGTLDPKTDLADLIAGDKSWPQPSTSTTGSPANIDDLWHATLNSRGDFILAQNADEFSGALQTALGAIADRLGSGASLAANSSSLDGDNVTYQARYWSGTWRGDLVALPVVNGRLADIPSWTASAALPAWASRKIYFNNGNENPEDAHQLFTWGTVSSANMGAALESEMVVNYLRGERSNEQTQAGTGTLRTRTSPLGDIVNSQPVYVGAPNPFLHANSEFTGAADYAGFAATNGNRRPVIYVGGNDGMLHGFDATTGAETYAFIPKAAINNGLADLASPNYGRDSRVDDIPHRYFVDGELTVADAHSSITGWHTVLIGTMGRGGRSVFALDVTDPDDVKFLWEKSSSDVPALGQVLGKPLVVKLGNNDWRVLVGNGMNSDGGAAQLLMFDVFSGAVSTVSTGATGDNGLSALLPWDSNGDGFTDMAYAGDRLGNLWRFSELGETPSVSKLFEARSSGGAAQPITAAPMVGINLRTKERWVFFGTGQYLNAEDIANNAVQSWYGLIDTGSLIGSRTDLVERTIEAEGEVNGFPARAISAISANDMTGKRGWYLDFNTESGERMITQNQYRNGALIGTTRIPDGRDPCNPTGRGYVMAIDPFTGARLPQTYFDLTLDGSFDSADMLTVNGARIAVSGVGFGAGPNNPTFVGTSMHVSLDDGSTSSFGVFNPIDDNPVARRSWRELIGN